MKSRILERKFHLTLELSDPLAPLLLMNFEEQMEVGNQF